MARFRARVRTSVRVRLVRIRAKFKVGDEG
jgi:hypothetical protein